MASSKSVAAKIRRRKPGEEAYHYRGQIEVPSPRRGHPGYAWRDGYSTGEKGSVSYPWMTKAECRRTARSNGRRAVFYYNGKRE